MGFSLINGIDYSTFTSAEVNNCDTAEEVFKIAKQVRDAFTGPAQIDPMFTLGSVINYSSDHANSAVLLLFLKEEGWICLSYGTRLTWQLRKRK